MDDEIQGLSIVMVGRFAPSSYTPAWFRLHELVSESEFKDSKIQIIVLPSAIFTMDWVTVSVGETHFQMTTAIPQEFDRLRDLAVGVLKVMDNPLLNAMGINSERHWQVQDRTRYDNFGHLLAPKERWKGMLDVPGMASLTMRGMRNDGWAGSVDVTIQPSVRIPSLGLYAAMNDHFVLKKTELHFNSMEDALSDEAVQSQLLPEPTFEGSLFAQEILGDIWQSRRTFADESIDAIARWSRE